MSCGEDACQRSLLVLFALAGVMAIVLAACAVPFIGSDSEEDRQARERKLLVAFYNATGGPEWKDNSLWLSELSLGIWKGVVYYSDERPAPLGGTEIVEGVNQLRLERNGLTGRIPSELGNFNLLSRIYLNGNQLTGEIPSQLGDLDNLTHLHLGGNQLSGEIPPELGNARFLSYLSLAGNELTGEIPSELENLKDLIQLNLSNNRLTGEIPAGLGRARRFSSLDLSGNQLTGTIPARFSGLFDLDLRDNDLTGTIPSTFASYAGRAMGELYLSGNRLSGCIPEELLAVQKNDLWAWAWSSACPTDPSFHRAVPRPG